jgi:hypothetical protein
MLVTVLAGVLTARQRVSGGAEGEAQAAPTTASESAALQSGGFMRTQRDERRGSLVEVDLDRVLGALGQGLELDRPALLQMLHGVVGDDAEIESKRIGDVLGTVSRLRVRSQGLSFVIGRRVLTQTLKHVLGNESVEDMTVAEVLDGLAGAKLTADGLAGLLDGDAVGSLLGDTITAVQRVAPIRDPRFLRRQVLERRYADVVDLVNELRRGELRDADSNVLYAEAHSRLVATGKRASIPLLDGYLRLEDELAATRVGTTSRAERIVLRWSARRKAFDEAVAELIFGRAEAMERYEVDRLALEADDSIAAEAKAQRLQERRQALKVELAAQGSYVSFADEARASIEPGAAEPAASEPEASASEPEGAAREKDGVRRERDRDRAGSGDRRQR